jgi:chorismate dehydratase
MIRIGAVEFLNARPLTYGLDAEPWCEVRFDVPSVCARLLHAGHIDVGLIPAIELLRGPEPYEIVAGPVVSCRGEVESVEVFSRVPVSEIRTLALDTNSRASVGLLRVLCARHFGIAPTFVDMAPDLPTMLQHTDAALLIGDPAFDAPWQAMGLERIDLGQAWWDMTGLPFVFAVWAARPGALTNVQAERLRQIRDQGLGAAEIIAADYAGGDPAGTARATRYLREIIRYDLDEDARRGLARYLELAVELGLAAAPIGGQPWVGQLPAVTVRT